ncbi:hypothetical protein HPT27_08020 [Permianibacter sp. IMCC34836]|uniref:hypothetical protein n=1 Tax=Permianibacter fluminis TaxID=2738515 RepID=UPI0015539D7B|nr:hypothetical protein [Permianibacter fluminis]NQD36968.1 hypothetical protein [Permianibacter fluminis]
MHGSRQKLNRGCRVAGATLAALLALMVALPGWAEEQILLSHDELQAWADARLQPRPQTRQPLWLAPLANDSRTRTDEALRDAGSSLADIERGGVPLSLLDALLAGQLVGSGRYELTESSSLSSLPLPQLQVRITRYHPAHRQGEEGSLSQPIKSHWHSWFADEPLPVYVTLSAEWYDPLRNHRRQLLITAASDTCLRMEQAPATASTPAPSVFTETYRHSAIGQATLAAFNRLLAWLDERNDHDGFALTISSVRGNRLQLQDPAGLLQPNEELTLFHRDYDDRRIGSIRISPQRAAQQSLVEAWPITLAAGSVRPGDEVRLERPAAGPLITPALSVPGSHCSSAETASAEETVRADASMQATETTMAAQTMTEPAAEPNGAVTEPLPLPAPSTPTSTSTTTPTPTPTPTPPAAETEIERPQS